VEVSCLPSSTHWTYMYSVRTMGTKQSSCNRDSASDTAPCWSGARLFESLGPTETQWTWLKTILHDRQSGAINSATVHIYHTMRW